MIPLANFIGGGDQQYATGGYGNENDLWGRTRVVQS